MSRTSKILIILACFFCLMVVLPLISTTVARSEVAQNINPNAVPSYPAGAPPNFGPGTPPVATPGVNYMPNPVPTVNQSFSPVPVVPAAPASTNPFP